MTTGTIPLGWDEKRLPAFPGSLEAGNLERKSRVSLSYTKKAEEERRGDRVSAPGALEEAEDYGSRDLLMFQQT